MEDAMVQLMGAFRRRNGNRMPEHVIVYRDGVGEGMFADVVAKEVVAMKKAVTLLGYMDDSVKFSVIVCQKRHHSRFVMEDTSSGGGYLNPCPGLVTDGRVAESITSPAFLEFYLNSHVAIQGTCKPCRYTVLYDEIGLKLSEIELMTYWTTYLYSRCNRSVSLATPAYYAHWATMRSKHLSAAGATREDIRQISDLWMDKNASMFFI
jgi:eukaryotic translation initiation factor 2C